MTSNQDKKPRQKKVSAEPRILHGSGASPGIVIGKALVLRRRTRRAGWRNLSVKATDREVERFEKAIAQAVEN